MKVHLIKRQTVEDYAAGHARSRSAFALWLTALKYADWNTPADIQRTFGAADLLGNGSNRVVFDIGGNHYRLIARYAFGAQQVTYLCAALAPKPSMISFAPRILNTLSAPTSLVQVLPYTVIKTASQYQQYCARLEELATAADAATRQDELDLLTLLIETWDRTHATLPEADPIELLRSLMASQGLAAKDLAALLEVGKSTVSDILNRRRGLSKDVIRRLASHFQVAQEAFNRPYELAVSVVPLPRAAQVIYKGADMAA